jgi:hypothetical protein
MNVRVIAALAISTGLLAFAVNAAHAADRPLAAFAGNWSGSGTITVKDGGRERIRCRGSNRSEGSTLNLGLKCASDSYKFELASDITSNGNEITGTWGETSRGVFGSLAGRINGGRIQAEAAAAGFTASLSITARGSSQSVSIKSPGSEISEVTISMARTGR